MKIKYTMTATIPTQQYGNLQPSIEVEATSLEEGQAATMPHIEALWAKYGSKPLETNEMKRASGARKLVKDIFGNEIYYDDISHVYTNSLGEVYLSGSAFAAQSEAPFNAEMISSKMAAKAGLSEADAQEIRDMWRLKADASASFGTSIHSGLELFGKYKQLCESLGKDTYIHDNTTLNSAIMLFYAEYPVVENIKFEALVIDHKKKRAGRIDRIEYEDDGVYVTDFKTNFDVKKSIKKYWLQLSFYAAILKANGLKVKGLKIYHYDGERWTTIPHEVIDIDK
jgi:hypothetical protein